MAKRLPVQSVQKKALTASSPKAVAAQEFLLFALFFVGLVLLHAPLLRLPYFGMKPATTYPPRAIYFCMARSYRAPRFRMHILR